MVGSIKAEGPRLYFYKGELRRGASCNDWTVTVVVMFPFVSILISEQLVGAKYDIETKTVSFKMPDFSHAMESFSQTVLHDMVLKVIV